MSNNKHKHTIDFWIIGILLVSFLIFMLEGAHEDNKTTKIIEAGYSNNSANVQSSGKANLTVQDNGNKTKCLTAIEAWSSIDKYTCVIYFVGYPYQSTKGNVFLNEKKDYKNGFTTTIYKSSELAADAVAKYGNKNIEVTGYIRKYENHPEIIINSSSQIKIIN